MSERYLRSGDSEFTPPEKPFVINPRSRADIVRPIRVPDWPVPLVRANPDQENEAIQFGSAAYHRQWGPREIKGIHGNRGVLACSRMEEPPACQARPRCFGFLRISA